MQKITTFLWFDNQAEEAANFYVSIFSNSKVLSSSRYGEGAPMPKGTVMTISFQLAGKEFIALNGGPHYKFTPAISLSVACEDQKEIDYYWERLTSGGGKPVQCGWLEDKFGLSWQVVPAQLGTLLSGDGDAAKAKRAMAAMLKMKKLEIESLRSA
ncbi:MAG TPA: VOC family protein [Terriglobales bacterium]|nr:VOC family protein [Terriglobales bacterium]